MYIIPEPQKFETGEGVYYLNFTHTICLDDSCAQENLIHAQLLRDELKESAGITLSIVRGASKNAGITLSTAQGAPESYTLSIGEHGAKITGADRRGLIYGVQTLRQIIRQEGALLP